MSFSGSGSDAWIPAWEGSVRGGIDSRTEHGVAGRVGLVQGGVGNDADADLIGAASALLRRREGVLHATSVMVMSLALSSPSR